MEDSRSSTSGSASSSTGKASATPDRYEQGNRVIIIGRDSGGEKTYRTATIVATSSSLPEAAREKDADVAANEVKVRFVGTAKGVPDERVQAKDVLKISEETLRLKKEYEARIGPKKTGRGRGRPRKVQPNATEAVATTPAKAAEKPKPSADPPPVLPGKAGAVSDRNHSTLTTQSLKPAPDGPSEGDGRPKKAKTKRKVSDMTASSSPATAVAVSSGKASKSARLEAGATPGSPSAKGTVDGLPDSVGANAGKSSSGRNSASTISSNSARKDAAKVKSKKVSSGSGAGVTPGSSSAKGTADGLPDSVDPNAGKSSSGKNNASTISSNSARKDAAKVKNKKVSSGSGGTASGDGGNGDKVEGAGKTAEPPPAFQDIVIEALRALSESRGSSQLAMVNWLKAGRYRPLAMADEAKFKSNVAAGIKQALEEGKLVRVRTNYRISPEHARALDLPIKTKARGGGKGSRKQSEGGSDSCKSGSSGQSEGAKESSAETSGGGVVTEKTVGAGGLGGGGIQDNGDGSVEAAGDESSRGTAAARKRTAEGWQELAEPKSARAAASGKTQGSGAGGGTGVKDDGREEISGKAVGEKLQQKQQAKTRKDAGGEKGGKAAKEGSQKCKAGEEGKREAPKGSDQNEANEGSRDAPKVGSDEGKDEGETVVAPKEGEQKGKGGKNDKKGGERRARPAEKTGGRKGRPPKTMGWESSGGGGSASSMELVEDEKLFSQEARSGDVESGQAPKEEGSSAVTLPARPVPVHRMQVPPQAVGDLLMVWDFLKTFGHELHANEVSDLTLEEFEVALISSDKKHAKPLIAGLNLALLREALGRNRDGSASRTAEMAMESMVPVRRMLGDLLNPVTWPEVLRRFATAHLRYSRALFSRHGKGEWLEEGHPLETAIETLGRRNFGDLSATQTLCVLRWLADVLMDTAAVRAKVNDHAERLSRQTAVDRKKAEAQDRAFVAESLTGAAEGSKVEGREAMSEQELKAAEEATLKEKEAAITTRAEEKRSAVRREALGWDREYNRYWWFSGDPSVFIHAEVKGGGSWGQYKSQAEADALRDSQHPRGKRGSALRKILLQNMEEMSVGFERVRVVEEAEKAAKRAEEEKERKRLEEIATAEAEAVAAAAAAMADGEEPRRSLRRKSPPPKTGTSLAVAKPAYRLVSEARGSRVDAARAAAAAAAMASAAAAAAEEAARPYVPQLPAWKQQVRRADREVLRNLKLELTTMEGQLARLGRSVSGGNSKDRSGWLREVHSARDALAIRRAAVQLEEAVYVCTKDMMGDLAIDWSSMVVTDGEDVSWNSPYDWSFLKTEARERRRGRDRERRNGGGGGGEGEEDIVGGLTGSGGGGALGSPAVPSSRSTPKSKRKVPRKKEGGREWSTARRAQAAAKADERAVAAEAVAVAATSTLSLTPEGTAPTAGTAKNAVFGVRYPAAAPAVTGGDGNGPARMGENSAARNKVDAQLTASSAPSFPRGHAEPPATRVGQALAASRPPGRDQKRNKGVEGVEQGRRSGSSSEVGRDDSLMTAAIAGRNGLDHRAIKNKTHSHSPSLREYTKAIEETTVGRASYAVGEASGGRSAETASEGKKELVEGGSKDDRGGDRPMKLDTATVAEPLDVVTEGLASAKEKTAAAPQSLKGKPVAKYKADGSTAGGEDAMTANGVATSCVSKMTGDAEAEGCDSGGGGGGGDSKGKGGKDQGAAAAMEKGGKVKEDGKQQRQVKEDNIQAPEEDKEEEEEEELLEDEEDEMEPEKRWEMERESIAMANMSAELQGALSMEPADRVAWRTGTFAARTVAGVATTIYGFVTAAASVLPLLQKQNMQEQALIKQDLATNQALHVRCSSTSEIVWARLHGFPWWPALVVKPDGAGFQRSLEKTGDRLVVFMNENDQFRVNHRFCRPFIGTSQDDIMRRASRGNKRMARAIKMGLKGLRVAYERLGSERDPNAPHNRPKFLDHDPAAQPTRPKIGDTLPLGHGQELEGGKEAFEQGGHDSSGKPHRAAKPRRTVEGGWEAEAPVEGEGPGRRKGAANNALVRGHKRKIPGEVDAENSAAATAATASEQQQSSRRRTLGPGTRAGAATDANLQYLPYMQGGQKPGSKGDRSSGAMGRYPGNHLPSLPSGTNTWSRSPRPSPLDGRDFGGKRAGLLARGGTSDLGRASVSTGELLASGGYGTNGPGGGTRPSPPWPPSGTAQQLSGLPPLDPHLAGGRVLRPRGAVGMGARSRLSSLDGVSSGGGDIPGTEGGLTGGGPDGGGGSRNDNNGRGGDGGVRPERSKQEGQYAASGVPPGWIRGSHTGARVAATARGAAAAAAAARNAANEGGYEKLFPHRGQADQERMAGRPSWVSSSMSAGLGGVDLVGGSAATREPRVFDDRFPSPPGDPSRGGRSSSSGSSSGGVFYVASDLDSSTGRGREHEQDAWVRNQTIQTAQRDLLERQRQRQQQRDLMALESGQVYPGTLPDQIGGGISSMMVDQQPQSAYTLQLRQQQQQQQRMRLRHLHQQQQQQHQRQLRQGFGHQLPLADPVQHIQQQQTRNHLLGDDINSITGADSVSTAAANSKGGGMSNAFSTTGAFSSSAITGRPTLPFPSTPASPRNPPRQTQRHDQQLYRHNYLHRQQQQQQQQQQGLGLGLGLEVGLGLESQRGVNSSSNHAPRVSLLSHQQPQQQQQPFGGVVSGSALGIFEQQVGSVSGGSGRGADEGRGPTPSQGLGNLGPLDGLGFDPGRTMAMFGQAGNGEDFGSSLDDSPHEALDPLAGQLLTGLSGVSVGQRQQQLSISGHRSAADFGSGLSSLNHRASAVGHGTGTVGVLGAGLGNFGDGVNHAQGVSMMRQAQLTQLRGLVGSPQRQQQQPEAAGLFYQRQQHQQVQPNPFDFQFQPAAFQGHFEQAHAGRNPTSTGISRAAATAAVAAVAPFGGSSSSNSGSDVNGGVRGRGGGDATATL